MDNRHSRKTSLETKTRMRKAMADLKTASYFRFKHAKLGIDQINDIILSIKIIDIETNKIVSERIRLWNSDQPDPTVNWRDRWGQRNELR